MNKLLPLLVLVAACGQANDPTAVSANEPILSGIVWGNRVHIMPYNAGATPAAAPAGAHLTYYGGRVVSNMQVVQVLWGGAGAGAGSGQYLGNVWNTTSPSMATFYQGVLNSGYVDWLTEYNTPATATNQVIGRGSFLAQYRITPSTTATSVSDATIQSELVAQINAGHLPAPTTDAAGHTNTYYAVFFPHGTTITQGGSSSCVAGGFCAYHGTIAATTSQKEVFYGVHPDMQAGSGCDTGCGGSTAFNNYTSVASHEAIETVTDAEVGIATVVGSPLAWYDSTNGEIGDICNAQQGTIVGSDGVTYTVQAEFSNAANNCVITRTATNDFSISASPTSLTVAAGASGTSTISTAVSSGTAGTVSLAVSGAPSGVTASLSPTSVTAGGSSTLTVTAASTAASATATLTITGTEGTVTHSTTVSLTVNGTTPPPPPSGITNGGFESGTTGWTTTGTAGVSTTAHSGVDSLQLGAATPTNGDSTAAQTFTAPSTGGTLSFWYKMTCPDSVTYDWATATLKDNTAGTTATVLAKTCATNASWVQVSATLTASHSYTITLVSHDDNYAGDPSYTLYDDVAIGTSAPPPPPPPGGITNGNFETGSLTGWTSTGTTSVSTVQKHGGTYSARLGSTVATNGDSTISQTFTAPTGTTSVALYYYMVCPDTVTYDWATVSLKDNTAGTTATLLAKTCTNSAAWTQVTGAVTAGHSYTVTLTSHDDNYASDPTYTYYDDVTVQ